jgi:hypothetical protein
MVRETTPILIGVSAEAGDVTSEQIAAKAAIPTAANFRMSPPVRGELSA